MNIDTVEKRTIVTLSRRNLEHLIKMLDMNVGMPALRRVDNGHILYVMAEENVPHYGSRIPGPGLNLEAA